MKPYLEIMIEIMLVLRAPNQKYNRIKSKHKQRGVPRMRIPGTPWYCYLVPDSCDLDPFLSGRPHNAPFDLPKPKVYISDELGVGANSEFH